MAATVKGLETLRVVETIYEEDAGENSPSSSPSTTPLRSRVQAWTLSSGLETDAVIHVQGSCFHLHKDPLASSSGYLKRQLTASSDINLTPPLNLTADTFTLVADYCYGGHLFITPFNVAPLLMAAELLEMTNDSGKNENLRRKTEAYFCRTIAIDRDYAAVVLRSCLALLPEAEMKAALVSRCLEANGDLNGDFTAWFDGVQDLSCQDFQLVVTSLQRRLTGSHDFLYRIVDFYLKEHGGKISEEEKTKICNSIDCTNLSSQLLVHSVQNPRMPLRFVVQAMFTEQLNTRRSVFSAAHTLKHHHQRRRPSKETNATTTPVTLGAILQQDATLRQVAQLRATMDSTSSRIQSLEQQINGMRSILKEPEKVKSESFRFSSERKVERGQRGSVSYGSFPAVKMGDERKDVSLSQGDQGHFGKRLMKGLKSAFRASRLVSKGTSRTRDEIKVQDNDSDNDNEENGNVFARK